MLYSGDSDTLPLKSIPVYVSRTSKEGRFTLRNLAGGSYKIFALKDGNTNYLFDQANEAVAFQDSLIRPSVEPLPKDTGRLVTDTLKKVREEVGEREEGEEGEERGRRRERSEDGGGGGTDVGSRTVWGGRERG